MSRVARRVGLLNLARLALERLLSIRGDHSLALRSLRDVLAEIGDCGALRQVQRVPQAVRLQSHYLVCVSCRLPEGSSVMCHCALFKCLVLWERLAPAPELLRCRSPECRAEVRRRHVQPSTFISCVDASTEIRDYLGTDLLKKDCCAAAIVQVTSRLVDMDPYGGAYTAPLPTPMEQPPLALHAADIDADAEAPSIARFPVIERTLEVPSWERLGMLLFDIRDSIAGSSNKKKLYSGEAKAGSAVDAVRDDGKSQAGDALEDAEQNDDASANTASANSIGTSSGQQQQAGGEAGAPSPIVLPACVPPVGSPSPTLPPPTLSTPIRIVLPEVYRDDEMTVTAHYIDKTENEHASPACQTRQGTGGGGGSLSTDLTDRSGAGAGPRERGKAAGESGSAGGGLRDGSPQHQEEQIRRQHEQQLPEERRKRRLQLMWKRRRPAVLKAMEEFSDGSSTDDSVGEESDGGRRAGGTSMRGGGRWGKYKREVERRTSGRLQKQDEMMREASVAAARENDMQVCALA